MATGTSTTNSQVATSFSNKSGPWTAQVPYIKQAFREAARLYKKGAPKYYPGETLAGFDPAETAAQNAILGYGMGPRAAAQQMAAEDRMMKGLSGQVDYSTFNPMMDYLGRQATSQLQKNVLPGIRSQMIGYQPGGGSRGNLIQQGAIAEANQQMLDKQAQLTFGAQQAAQDRALNYMGQYPTVMSAPIGLFNAMSNVGAQRRAMTQEAMNRDQQRYNYEAMAPQNALSNYLAMITGNYGGTSSGTSGSNTSSTSTYPMQNQGFGSSLFGSFGQSLGQMLPSLIFKGLGLGF